MEWIKTSEKLPEDKTDKIFLVLSSKGLGFAAFAGGHWIDESYDYELFPSYWIDVPDFPNDYFKIKHKHHTLFKLNDH